MNNHLDTTQKIYEAFGKGDVPFILQQLSDNVEWEQWQNNFAQKAGVPWLIYRKGPAEVLEFFKEVGKLKFHGFEIKNMMAGGNQVAVEVVLDIEILDSGNRFMDEEIHLWNFDDAGKVVRMRHYGDTAKHKKAAGL